MVVKWLYSMQRDVYWSFIGPRSQLFRVLKVWHTGTHVTNQHPPMFEQDHLALLETYDSRGFGRSPRYCWTASWKLKHIQSRFQTSSFRMCLSLIMTVWVSEWTIIYTGDIFDMSSRQNYWMNRVVRSCLELWSSSSKLPKPIPRIHVQMNRGHQFQIGFHFLSFLRAFWGAFTPLVHVWTLLLHVFEGT